MSDVILSSLGNILNLTNLLYINLGLAAGVVFGAIPGLTATTGICMLLPITFGMDTVPAMLLLLGLYCGGVYGGSITAVLIRTPGTVGAAMTVLDGHPMAVKGHPGKALDTALKASTYGGLLSAVILLFAAPVIAQFAIKFASAEKFALAVFGIVVVSSLNMKNQFKGLISAFLGILVSCIGTDPIEGLSRLTFGSTRMLSGINTIPVLIGIFAITEILNKVHAKDEETVKPEKGFNKEHMTWKEFKSCFTDMTKSAVIGAFIGAVPGTGTGTAATLCYAEAQRSSKTPELFGTGHINGLAAPEAGNNGVTGAALIPTLTLGIPGDTSTAVLLGALAMQGITPGPAVFERQPVLMYTIMLAMFVINVFMFLQGRLFIKAFVNVVKIPAALLNAIIIAMCTIGAYSVNNSIFDVFVMITFAAIGYLMNRVDMPTTPLLMGVILGSMAESNLRRVLAMSNGSWLPLFTKPMSCIILVISILLVLVPLCSKAFHKLRPNREQEL